MVKCLKGTPEQIKAAQAYFNRLDNISDSVVDTFTWISDQEHDVEEQELSEDWELDSIKADKRCPPTPLNDLVYYFVNVFLEFLLESWSGKPCYRNKMEDLGTSPTYSNVFNDYPNTLSETPNYINDLYKRRESTLSKETTTAQVKNDINITKSEFGGSEDSKLLPESSKTWSNISETFKPPPDENVYFVFLNGVWYKGRVSRKLMEGQGIYFWADGSLYEGEFVGGCVTGKGRLEFPDLSVYEGDLYKGFRHGEGMHCLYDSPVMYSGQWWLGEKHGEGLIVYNDPSNGHNFYKGTWENGMKEGFGYRQYPSGAKYIGFWSNGKRHGKGVMLWSNNDIYRGHWKEGLMHGYGEYTWNGFVNKTLSYPATNMYRGYWQNGKRFGNGIFETINGGIIETIWNDNMKEGPGAVTCANSTVIVAEYLFRKDKQALFKNEEDMVGQIVRNKIHDKKEDLEDFFRKLENPKAISIPIHLSVADINLKWHIYRYYIKKREEFTEKRANCYDLPNTNEKFKFATKYDDDVEQLKKRETSDKDLNLLCECAKEEEKFLRNYIIGHISKLRILYDFYSTLPCEKPSSYKCVMLRLFLWQLLLDCEIPNSNFSLVDLDEMIAQESYLYFENPHDPFERIQFAQFIHILLILSWHLYAQYVFDKNPLAQSKKLLDFLKKYEESEPKLVLVTALAYLLENDIFAKSLDANFNQDCITEKRFSESDLIPITSLFKVYSQMGQPPTARDFLINFCSKNNELFNGEEILNDNDEPPLGKIKDKHKSDEISTSPLPSFIISEGENTNCESLAMLNNIMFYKKLSPKKVMECLSEACPGIVCDGYIVNIDYKLSFLEFYNAIFICTKLMLKLNKMKEMRNSIIEKHKKKLEEYQTQINKIKAEKAKMRTVSSKKSKRTDVPKQGK